ncbi:hypothetical protein MA03_07185 [Infirmifilum uzonense]|uniref:PD-(D/E)XK endonuclease-like domain-containing protein n=1 Tax=Infirmifilum uzonense TaxID=1550241 RepID=A0A0F7FJH7_9CREN|nr:hypothetical protein [Infirmifilum uzonense]AKG39063.1 hypothetical protein MA03_07185 [Infirmifilum uzonense]
MPGSLLDAQLRATLERWEKARAAKDVYYVTEVASGSRGQGRGVSEGRRVHSKIWGLDPFEVLNHSRISLPLPVAWRFRFGWLLGVVDQVLFVDGLPVEVAELKSYDGFKSYEKVQASLYGLLVMLNFQYRPRVSIIGMNEKLEINNWEEIAIEALVSFCRKRNTSQCAGVMRRNALS